MLEFMKIVATRAGTSVRTLLADLRGVGQEDDDANAEPVSGAEMLFPHGFVARPSLAATLEALVARIGDEVVALFPVNKGSAAFSPTVEEGETRVYNVAGAMVRLLSDGAIEIRQGATVVAKVDTSGVVHVGAASGASFVALATNVASELTALKTAISSAATVPNDGGAAFKANILASLTTWPGSVAATKAKAT